jgi:ribose 5-phosphate isomerase B
MKISIGCDHAGYDYKEAIKNTLEDHGHIICDHGPYSSDSVDYPEFAHPVAQHVSDAVSEYGILICGSGNGVSMTANKHNNVRAALCWTKEIAQLAREHNNANIICIPARFTSIHQAIQMVDVFLKTAFEGGRHERRVGKISLNC